MKKFEEVCKNHKYCEEIVTKETRYQNIILVKN